MVIWDRKHCIALVITFETSSSADIRRTIRIQAATPFLILPRPSQMDRNVRLGPHSDRRVTSINRPTRTAN